MSLDMKENSPMAGNREFAQPRPAWGFSPRQSCFPLGICRKRKVMVAKSGSLSLKQPVKAYPIFSHKVFHLIFYGKPREKSTLQSIKVFTCHGPFSVC